MARDISFQQLSESRRLEHSNPWVWLFDFELPTTPARRMRLTSHDEPVPYLTKRYEPAAIGHSGVTDPGDGALPSITITLQDTLGIAASLIDDHDGLEGMEVAIRVLSWKWIALQEPVQELIASVTSSTIVDEGSRIAFTLGGQNIYEVAFPRRIYTRARYPGIKR